MPQTLSAQIVWLFLLAIPIACIARTVVYEEVFREARDYCVQRSQTCRTIVQRKVFYLFTCEYCFSHYIAVVLLMFTALGEGPGYRLLIPDWRGYVLAFFSLVFVANLYLNIYGRLRVDIHQAKVETKVKEQQLDE